MRLLPGLAHKLISEVKHVLDEDFIIVDETSTIIASTETERIGHFHAGAAHVFKTRKKLYITEANQHQLPGTRHGINLPITFQHQLIGVIGVTGKPRLIEPFADLLLKMTELLINETYHREQMEWQSRGVEAFVSEWISSGDLLEKRFIQRGHVLGISIETPYTVIKIDVSISTDEPVHLYANDWLRMQLLPMKEDFFIRWGKNQFLFLMKEGDQRERSRSKNWKMIQQAFTERYPTATCAIGISHSLAQQHIKKSYDEAEKALNVAKKKQHVVFYDSLLLEMITDETTLKTKQAYVDRTIGSFVSDEALLHTLRGYINSDQSIKETAASLHIHTNTLHYRLQQISERMGINVRTPKGMTIAYLALVFLDEQ
ncbi:sugar diacid recognition domain-containing protein [Shouchella sp. 1P09AA]|uniref:CdaR family transcriptional regulator n=1 Tax=unclassified Shouchella TaxID=2893065 RepID=UPI0039A01EBE